MSKQTKRTGLMTPTLASLKTELASAELVNSRSRVRQLMREIRELEEKHGISTEEMLDKICAGDIADKGVYAEWRRKFMILRTHQEYVRTA